MSVVTARAVLIAAAAALAAAGCAEATVINTDEAAQRSPVSSATAPPSFSTANLVDAADYAAKVDGRTGYYFSTPSGRWRCAILPRHKAGCQSVSGLAAGMDIPGEPDGVPDGEGGTTAVNAIAVDRDHDARFVVLTEPEFALNNPTVLPFGKALAVAGFRCNVQEESGVSCLRELTGKGFTFSAEGFTLQYTDLP